MTDVSIVLTPDEALVLFEMLHRWEDARRVGPELEQGEQVALWAVSSRLESLLVEPFQDSYMQLVKDARQRLAADAGGESS